MTTAFGGGHLLFIFMVKLLTRKSMKKQYWIMKSEPSEFSIDDLQETGEAFWDGVRNYQVRNMFRDIMRVGDKALFYHSNTKEIGIVGEMEISQTAIIDHTQFDSKSKYYDEKSSKENPRWIGPSVRFVKKFKKIVSLDKLKTDRIFSDLPFIKKGNRLSVIQITKEQFQKICELGR